MNKSSLITSAAVAFAAVYLFSFEAMAALPAPPFLADLTTLRTWALVIAVFIVFAGILAIGSSIATGQWQRGAVGFLALVVGAGIIAQATGLTAGLTGGGSVRT